MSAITEIKQDLARVESGQRPLNNAESLAKVMGLNGSKPDGRSLRMRLFGYDEERDSNDLRRILASTKIIAEKMSYRRGNENEELLASALIGVALMQYNREGDICPMAKELLLRAGTGREDLVPKETMDRLIESIRADQLSGGNTEIVQNFSGIVVVKNRFDFGDLRRPFSDRFGDNK